MIASETGAFGAALSTVPSASWALSITPKVGWGTSGDTPSLGGLAMGSLVANNPVFKGVDQSSRLGVGQKATAGWLSLLPLFEPHWQVRRGAGALGQEGGRGANAGEADF